jgi:hypothetical protein
MKTRSHKKNKNKNTKKKFGGDVEGFPDLFNSSGKLSLTMNPTESKNNNNKYYAGIAGALVLVGVLISVKK